MLKTLIEIYELKADGEINVKTTSEISGDVDSVIDFIKDIRNNFYPECLIREVDINDNQIQLFD